MCLEKVHLSLNLSKRRYASYTVKRFSTNISLKIEKKQLATKKNSLRILGRSLCESAKNWFMLRLLRDQTSEIKLEILCSTKFPKSRVFSFFIKTSENSAEVFSKSKPSSANLGFYGRPNSEGLT